MFLSIVIPTNLSISYPHYIRELDKEKGFQGERKCGTMVAQFKSELSIRAMES